MTLEPDEKILKIIRKHPFYLILETTGLVVIAILPDWLLVGWQFMIDQLPISEFSTTLPSMPPSLQGFLYSLWLLIIWFIWLTRFTDFYLDKWVITNKRIIDIEQIGFFARETSSVRYDKIQDVSADVKGFFETVLKFGTITVQTAGSIQQFQLSIAPNPIINKEFIIEQKYRHSNH